MARNARIQSEVCDQSSKNEGAQGPQLELLDSSVLAGSAIYGNALLAIYDLYVLGLSNTFAWKCRTPKLLQLYNDNVTSNHLDIGVGTGFYLDRCSFPDSSPRITLGDLNPNCLKKVSERITRYSPAAKPMNVFDPKTFPTGHFSSIGINYLLHCLPGPPQRKLVVLSNLKPLLADGGVLFGSTILGTEAPHNAFGRFLMKAYNRKGIFSNVDDNVSELKDALKANFKTFDVEVNGCVALFTARN